MNTIILFEISDSTLDLIGVMVGSVQILMAILEIIALVFVSIQLKAQKKQIKIEEESIQTQKRQEYLKQTYQVMETRLLEILKLKYDINVQLDQDIVEYCKEKYKIPLDKITKKDKNRAKEKVIKKYKEDEECYLQRKNVNLLLNSYEYLCSAIKHKFVDEEIIKEEHQETLIKMYEDYRIFIEPINESRLYALNEVYKSWKITA